MSIEINKNNMLTPQDLTRSNDAEKTAATQTNTTPQEAATNSKKATDTVTISENTAKIQRAISQLDTKPVEDTNKIEQIRQSIEQGTFEILSNDKTTRLNAANRIMEKLIAPANQTKGLIANDGENK